MIQIIDLDGCVSDDRWRRPMIRREDPDLWTRYEEYHAACFKDTHINRTFIRFDLHIIIITGRPDAFREHTVYWLQENNIPAAGLIMRPNDNHRPGVEWKREACLYLFAKLDPLHVTEAIDDQEDIVKMYASAFNLRSRVVGV